MFLEWENNSGKLQIISGKFQNNAINDVKQISLSHMIKWTNFFSVFFSPTLILTASYCHIPGAGQRLMIVRFHEKIWVYWESTRDLYSSMWQNKDKFHYLKQLVRLLISDNDQIIKGTHWIR